MKSVLKRFFLFSIFFSLFAVKAQAQAPEKMSYQAVIRNASNGLLTNQAIGMRVTILQGSATGTEVYKEVFTPNPTTNMNGLVTVEVGTGTPVSGTFAGINWGNGPYFIKTETDPTGGSSYSIVGTSQLQSVPYALYAKSSGNVGWSLSGNSGTNPASNFIGTTDDKDLVLKRNNLVAGKISLSNISFGLSSLASNTTGYGNTAIGNYTLLSNTTGFGNTTLGDTSLANTTTGSNNTASGIFALNGNTTGSRNTAIGASSLISNTTANNNTAVGNETLKANTTGSSNTALGASSLFTNTNGSNNTAIGNGSLFSNTIGARNAALGVLALNSNSTGADNFAAGFQALGNNSTGNSNVAIGNYALEANTIANYNTSIGFESLKINTLGEYNTATGYRALEKNTLGNRNTAYGNLSMFNSTTGNNNTAIGDQALTAFGFGGGTPTVTGNFNTAVGAAAMQNAGSLISGSSNCALGYQALTNVTSGSNNIGIGRQAQVPNGTASNQIRIGNTDISYAGTQVAWSVTSDSRWKENIQPSNLGLRFITDLNPVFYTRKNDDAKKAEYGIIAQELEASLRKFGAEINGIITKDDQGMYSVRYNDLLAPMIKAIQEQQVMIEALKAEIHLLKTKN